MRKFIWFSLVILASSAYAADWWQNANFYQIYPRSFKDSNNDGVGDIRGIIDKLSHLEDIGVTATWLSPVLKSPQVDFGYDIADFKNVDEIFGTNEDLYELFEKAHEKGIKVIMDFVPNHTSDEHEWFKKSVKRDGKYANYYVWHNGLPNGDARPLPPNNWQAVFSTRAWTWNEEREQYYLHQFAAGQPDLDYRNQDVVKEMKDVLTFWMEKGADGFRIDAINHLFENKDFLSEPLTNWTTDKNSYGYTHHIYTKDLQETYDMVKEWRELIDKYNEDNPGSTRVIFTEAYASVEDTVRYYRDNNGEDIAHFPFNFLLIEKLNEKSNAYQFKNEIDIWLTSVPEGATSNWVLGNHDKPRFASRYGTERVDGLMMLLLTLPGVAVTYNGDEIGMIDHRDISWVDTLDPQACNTNDPNNYKDASRDPQRTPYQWDSTAFAGFKPAGEPQPWVEVHPNYVNHNLELQKAAPKSFYKFYKQLSALRKSEVFMNGNFKTRAVDENVLAFQRNFGEETVISLINFKGTQKTVDLSSEFELLLDGTAQIIAAGSMSSYNVGDSVNPKSFILRSYDAVILKVEKSTTTDAPTNPPPTNAPTAPPPTNAPTTPAQADETTTLAGNHLIASIFLLFASLLVFMLV